MVKESIKILKEKDTPKKFTEYLENKIGAEVYSFLRELSSFSDVLIFSGIIRNFFLKYKGDIRDFDIVINTDEILIEKFLKKFGYKKNSFGGYKIQIRSLKIDIWHIETTWAYSKQKIGLELFKHYSLPDTAFFNFSSVVFDFKNQEFISSLSFERFLETKEIDLVLEENPMPQLCIVNTIYYKQKYRLSVSRRLQQYCLFHFNEYSEEQYQNIQLKHFNEVKYPYIYIKEYLNIFKRNLNMVKK